MGLPSGVSLELRSRQASRRTRSGPGTCRDADFLEKVVLDLLLAWLTLAGKIILGKSSHFEQRVWSMDLENYALTLPA